MSISTPAGSSPSDPSLSPGQRDSGPVCPLSFAQERLWLLHQLNPLDAAYNEPFAWQLSGALDVRALNQALDQLVRRHEILRTVFCRSDGQPVQVVLPELRVALEWREVSPTQQQGAEPGVEAWIQQEVRRPFDLAQGPLIRASLFKLADQEHVLLLILHHIIIDGWSLGTLCKELGALYEAARHREASPLPAPPLQYQDFSRWQRGALQDGSRQGHLAYWQEKLSGVCPVLELPFGSRHALPGSEGHRHTFSLSPDLTASLKSLARSEGATPFMVLMTGFQFLLHRCTGQETFLVGTPIANRTQPEWENLLGFFANTVVIKADFAGDPTVSELIGRVREAAFGAYEHQDLPFEKLVAELHPERHLGLNPLFQVALAFHNAPDEPLEFTGLSVHRLDPDPGTAKFALTLFLEDASGGIKGAWQYRTNYFDNGSIAQLTHSFQKILGEMTARPNQLVSEVNLLTEAGLQQILVEWNNTTTVYPKHLCLHQLFEEQVERTPEVVAIESEGQSLSYRELNAQANQLAHYLRNFGVRSRDRVGVMMARSAEYVVTVLGILKAGAAYVPVNSDTPPARLRQVLENAGIQTLISGPAKPIRDPGFRHVEILTWQRLVSAISDHSQCNPPLASEPTEPAYVMHTSGSTGQPKGVEVPHRAVIRLVCGNNYLPFDHRQVFLLLAPLEFDASTLELWGPLLHGSKLAVYSRPELEILRLRSILDEHGVTCLWLTSALFNAIIDQQPDALRSVKHLMIGGEALSASHVRRAQSQLPGTRIINGYGPTETTTFATTFAIPNNFPDDAQAVPIGRPIANTQVYILDSRRNPVPIGVQGEIFIGGDGLACGYLNDPESTAASFVPHPFRPGTRLYRTGDLGRFRPDGNIEFLGRNDQQVKIRGYRVEPGEIESILKQHPAVRDALVAVRQNGVGDKRLAAWLTLGDTRIQPPELRQFLEDRLPAHMVPAAFVILDRFPLTANGKVDRAALPAPEAHHGACDSHFTTPRTQSENLLAEIWREVLGIEHIGLRDNFFDLGGHSLAAARVQVRVERETGTRLPLSAFFQHPTVGGLAQLLEDKPTARSSPLQLLSAVQSETLPSLFCLDFLSAAQRLATHLGSVCRVQGVESEMDAELRHWHQTGQIQITMETIAARCRVAIQQVQPRGPYLLAGFCFGGVLAFEVAAQLKRQGEKVALLALMDAVYHAGCPAVTMSGFRRWGYHTRRAMAEGPRYLLTKLGQRRQTENRRREQLKEIHSNNATAVTRQPSPEWPRAAFLSELLVRYRATPFDGNALLFRTVAEPNSFHLDLGSTNGWAEIIRGQLQVEDIDCNHADISEEPHVAGVARTLVAYLLRNQI